MVQAENTRPVALKKKRSKLWKNYYTLYMHYAYGSPMPNYFPSAVLDQFPDHSYKEELKHAISVLQSQESYNDISGSMQLIRA